MRPLESQPAQAVAHVRKNYPNGTLAVSSGAVATCVMWVATELGVDMNATAGAAFATVIIGVLTFIGRKGIKGAFVMLWDGEGDDDE